MTIKRILPWIGIAALAIAMVVAVLWSTNGEGSTEGSSAGTDAGLIEAGDALYQANCAACHGADLRGTALGPSHLSIVYEPNHHSDAAFLVAIRNGVRQHHWPFGDMPPVPGLSDEDIAAIVAFVRDQQRIHGFEPYPPSS